MLQYKKNGRTAKETSIMFYMCCVNKNWHFREKEIDVERNSDFTSPFLPGSRLTGGINDACARACRRGLMRASMPSAERADFDVAVGRRRLPTRPRVTRSARVNTCTRAVTSREAPSMSFAYVPARRRTITGVTDVHRGCSLEATACCTHGRDEERGEGWRGAESAKERRGQS